MNNENQSENVFKTIFIFGIVIQGDVEDITKIKEFIMNKTECKLVYQKISSNKLWIVEGDEDEG